MSVSENVTVLSLPETAFSANGLFGFDVLYKATYRVALVFTFPGPSPLRTTFDTVIVGLVVALPYKLPTSNEGAFGTIPKRISLAISVGAKTVLVVLLLFVTSPDALAKLTFTLPLYNPCLVEGLGVRFSSSGFEEIPLGFAPR